MPDYILRHDAVSYKGNLYAKAGTRVKIISERGNALIVERPDGFRFSTTRDRLIKVEK